MKKALFLTIFFAGFSSLQSSVAKKVPKIAPIAKRTLTPTPPAAARKQAKRNPLHDIEANRLEADQIIAELAVQEAQTKKIIDDVTFKLPKLELNTNFTNYPHNPKIITEYGVDLPIDTDLPFHTVLPIRTDLPLSTQQLRTIKSNPELLTQYAKQRSDQEKIAKSYLKNKSF